MDSKTLIFLNTLLISNLFLRGCQKLAYNLSCYFKKVSMQCTYNALPNPVFASVSKQVIFHCTLSPSHHHHPITTPNNTQLLHLSLKLFSITYCSALRNLRRFVKRITRVRHVTEPWLSYGKRRSADLSHVTHIAAF